MQPTFYSSHDRRQGILTILFFALVLVLAGCGRQNAAASADKVKATVPAARAATPVVRPTATPKATATSQPKLVFLPALRNPAPTATPTPTPEPPTPTPTATPFPPGPPSKLGVFVGRNDPQVFRLLRTGNLRVVKTLEYDPNFVGEIKQVDADVFVVARYTPLPLPSFDNWDPLAAAGAFADLLLPIATEPRRLAAIDCWEAYNEPVVANEEEMSKLAAFEAERIRLLAEAGVKSCVGNFGAGQPPLELWPAFFPALAAAQEYGGYLALHEYSAPYLWFGTGEYQNHPTGNEGDEGWLTLRYRKVYRAYLEPAGLVIPLVITEAGIDGLVGNRPGPPSARGWQEFGDFWRGEEVVGTSVFGFYMEQLAWYDAELARDDYVIGAAIFALAAPQGWTSYEIGGDWLGIFEQYLSVHPPK
ncbi:MAG: hypothetical protein D6775_12630 [Caldilineae bacterium]|nr:MAG: hypothetical protein D6775_12630 [Caldilineae bacterium]